MVLSTAQAYDLLCRHGALRVRLATDAALFLAAVCYTRRGESPALGAHVLNCP